MKRCGICKIEKETQEFAKHKKSPDGLYYWCRDCFRNYQKDKYNEDIEKSRNKTNNRRAERIKWVQELKSNIPCKDCGQIYEPYCMDYDHIPELGIKIKAVSRMVLDNTPKETILEEIKKCELVCLLCHNKRTYDRFNEKLGNDRKYMPCEVRNINIINDFKNKPCAMCNIQYESYNMQIDHIDPSTKLYDVCQLKGKKVEVLQVELDKCQVLCALCHRKKSILEQQDKKYSVSRIKPEKRKNMFLDIEAQLKECAMCHECKSFELFSKKSSSASGLFTYCKDCFNKYKKERRNKNKPINNNLGIKEVIAEQPPIIKENIIKPEIVIKRDDSKRGAKRMMDVSREKAILKAYANGDIISKIEKDFETGRSSIYRILNRNGISRERPNKSWQGKTHSEETKEKMSEARKAYWDGKKS